MIRRPRRRSLHASGGLPAPPSRSGSNLSSSAARTSDGSQPSITLWTLEICGVPGSAPNSARIGSSVWPNASNSFCDSQMSKTWISPSVSRATWYNRPGGEPDRASSSFLIESSYVATVKELGVK
jgi:hypothetical protein